MNKKWEYLISDQQKVKDLVEKYNFSELLASILINRGITQKKDIDIFLNPTRENFHNADLMPDIDKAISRIIKAKNEKEKIMIYGDYDVDGITSIVVLKQFLDSIGVETSYYIPNRLSEGYGLNKAAIKKMADEKVPLLITVDCGISGHEEIEYANSLGIETIITDHHEPGDTLPNAIAIVNPKRSDSKYPFRDLAGVGVVFKLIQALGNKLNLDSKEYLKYLDIVCVGTISDIVPLIDENRVIVKLGLKLVEQTRNIGLKTLIKACNLKRIDSTSISFGVAPRINACGRMGYQEEALKLFLTDNISEAEKITEELNNYNKLRQDTEKAILIEALEKIEKEHLEEKDCIVLAGKNWHHGVIGIVASKITEMYYKPTILLCVEDEVAKGSGRSIPGFDLYKALYSTSKYLEKYGGHEMAVGLSLKSKNVQPFKNSLKELVYKTEIENIVPIIYIDKLLDSKDISIDAVQELKVLEPYGEANKMPVFAIKNLKIDSIRALSEGKHLKLTLKIDNKILDAIGFGMGELVNEYQLGDKVDVVGNLEINSFNDKKVVQMNLKNIIKSY